MRFAIVGHSSSLTNLALAARVGLLPTGPGGFCVIELSGAVDFRPVYSFAGRDVHSDAIAALGGAPSADGGALELLADQIS
jgi:hypothetical protein